MPGFLGGGSSGSSGAGGEIRFPKEFVDPVTKLRVSNPQNLIDTDFEYGLQPTKWETVELINNTPSFFSKSGDTTIPGILSITTNAGTREITVTTALDHGLAVGIPISVTGTKSVTADGAYIINSIPNGRTFTYLSRDNEPATSSIEDLYSSIITGEFFQGSQLRVADSSGITTDGESLSTLTVKTESTHGFGVKTPFYFLNLNSTISQEFQAANTAAKSFDASNSATAQTFDGSNTLSSIPVDWSNSATIGGTTSTISSVSTTANTITVAHGAENFVGLPIGTPLYYRITTGVGFFAANPFGVVFLKTNNTLGSATSTFQVSLVPDGDPVTIEASLSGTFVVANQAKTFAGNNVNPLTETSIEIIKGSAFLFDGGNQGFSGTQTNGISNVEGYAGTILVSTTAGAGLDYYVGAMLRYTTTGSAASGLVNNRTYFVKTFVANATPNLYNITISEFPDTAALAPTGGTGTQTFSKIGVSVDKDVVHIKDANFVEKDMIEYVFPENGRFTVATSEETKIYYFVEKAYDAHNYLLSQSVFSPIIATGGTTSEITYRESTYRIHTFTNTGTSSFTVSNAGSIPTVEYLIVGGGGGAGTDMGGGGGGGGFLTGTTTISAQTYSVVVGAGGQSSGAAYTAGANNGLDGGNSSVFGLTAIGGGGGGGGHRQDNMPNTPGRLGGSGGGAAGRLSNPGAGTAGQGFGGSFTGTEWNAGSGGGAGGAATIGLLAGPGRASSITGSTVWYGGGGGRGGYTHESGNGGVGGGGGGAGGASGLGRGVGGVRGLNVGGDGVAGFQGNTIIGGSGGANTGGGAGGHAHQGTSSARSGGSGIVVIRYPLTPLPDFVAAIATGGSTSTIISSGITYRIHAFTTIGTTNFVVTTPGSWNDFEYLIVAGGGGGGGWGGGGGAGGLRTGRVTLTAGQTYPVVVGAGGIRGTSTYTGGGPGGNSSAFGITANGGGGGGWYNGNNGFAGGSGGGAGLTEGSGAFAAGGAGNSPSTSPIQGTSGGSGGNNNAGSWQTNRAGGGGGAGEKGYDGAGTGPNAGRGGRGLDFSFLFGTSFGESGWFAGGGGGHSGSLTTTTIGGQGGGGRGGRHAGGNGVAALSGTANTGGGGGGAWGGNATEAIGDGGSGIVLVRYPIAIA